MEEVARIVLGLDFLKPAIIWAVGGNHRITDLVVVEVTGRTLNRPGGDHAL